MHGIYRMPLVYERMKQAGRGLKGRRERRKDEGVGEKDFLTWY